jgi:hypothetical protein
MKRYFEKSKWQRHNLNKWHFMHIRNIIAINSSLFLSDCLQKICDDMNILQQSIDFKYHDSNYLRENFIRACKDHSEFVVELHNSSINSFSFIDSFCINIVNWKTTNKSTKHTYLQSIDDSHHDQCHDQCFTNRQYRRENFNNRDNDRFLFNFRFRDKLSICVFKICFVCDKSACWSTNHIEKEREKSKKRFMNRNLTFKTRSKFERRFEQFIVDYEDNDVNEFVVQYFEKLIIDDVSQKEISNDKFVIEINNEFKTFLIFVKSINDIETFTTIINMFVNKKFKHKFISKNDTIVFVISISYIYIIFITSKYDDRELKKILIDHDVADFSFKNIEQFTILQRINKTTLSLNKNKIIFFKFDIDETFFIDTINLNTSIDVITFHIVFVHISFLLCFVNMNRLRFYFNNLINMFIEKQSSTKVLFQKIFYFTYSNQIKRFQI